MLKAKATQDYFYENVKLWCFPHQKAGVVMKPFKCM